MVDAEYRFLRKGIGQDSIQLLSRYKIRSERLFDDDTGACGAIRFFQLFDHFSESHRWNRKVERRPLCGTQFCADPLKGSGIVVVAPYIAQQPRQFVEGCSIDSTVLFEAR